MRRLCTAGPTGSCPTGVATQDPWLAHGLDPELTSHRTANDIKTLRRDLLKVSEARGVEHPALIGPESVEIIDMLADGKLLDEEELATQGPPEAAQQGEHCDAVVGETTTTGYRVPETSKARAAEAVRLVVIADTHVPRRARDLPAELWRSVQDADVVLHAGDWVDVCLLDALSARAQRVVGVYGNNDGPELRARLPEVAAVDLGGLRIAMVHDTGSATGRERRCSAQFPDADVLVFGHSHIPWDTTTDSGLRLLNPGSPTDRRRQPFCTYLTATGAAGALHDVRLHRLPPRSS